jgi:hypothetical protein
MICRLELDGVHALVPKMSTVSPKQKTPGMVGCPPAKIHKEEEYRKVIWTECSNSLKMPELRGKNVSWW